MRIKDSDLRKEDDCKAEARSHDQNKNIVWRSYVPIPSFYNPALVLEPPGHVDQNNTARTEAVMILQCGVSRWDTAFDEIAGRGRQHFLRGSWPM